jgi:hypothetical protein
MLAKAAAISLTLGAALADSGGSHQAAYYLLLGAVPATCVAALASLGDLVEAGRPVAGLAVAQTLLSVLVTMLVVVTTAARSTSLLSGQIPRVAVSALVGCLVLYAVQGVLACLADLRHRAARAHERAHPHADRPLSRAA